MNEINIEDLKKIVKQIVDNELEAYINEGHNLLQSCQKYDIINKNSHSYICEIKGHKQQVLNFIRQIDYEYSNLINFYSILHGFSSSNSSQIDCRALKSYVDFLDEMKILKDEIDKISSYDELKNILKSRNNKF